uniref:Uncharacterized protein n=1 Tax=Anguilla anguilla TaxID=7936 RepID=A0A0E9VRX3_ANGAN
MPHCTLYITQACNGTARLGNPNPHYKPSSPFLFCKILQRYFNLSLI